MPTARKLKSGSWRCQVYVGTEYVTMPDGTVKERKKRKSFTVSDPSPYGKKECERRAALWAAERKHEEVEDITLGDAIDEYIEERESVYSPCTVTAYKKIRRLDMQSLMNMKVDQITSTDIQKAVNNMAKTHRPKSIRNARALVTAVLRVYCPDKAYNVVMPKDVRPNIYVPSDGDIQRLIEYVSGTEMELPILLAAFGPMRRGEICALMSDDIEGNIVHVHRNLVRVGNGEWIEKAPKSYAGDRYIEYPDFVAAKWKGIKGRIVDMCPNTLTHNFGFILIKAGLPHFRFHDLRHYSASIQHAIGVPDEYIMQRGGWSSDGTLKNVYRHAMDDKQEEMNKKANDYFSALVKEENDKERKGNE